MKNVKRKGMIFFIIGLFCFLGHLAINNASAEWPDKPINLYCAMAAGGAVDICTRTIASEAEKLFGEPVVVQQKTGGLGGVGLTFISNVKADGYDLISVPSTAVIQAAMFRKANFKPLTSFTPLLGYGSPQNAMLVRKDAPWKTFKEFLSYAKANPGKIKYSSPGSASIMHLGMLYVAKKEGINWVHVPYKGTRPAATALLGGHVDAGFAGSEWVQYVDSGAARPLMSLTEKRIAEYPDLPTLTDMGYEYTDHTLFCVVGPAGIDPSIVKKIDQVFKEAWESDKFQRQLKHLNMAPKYFDSRSLNEYLKSEWDYWSEKLKDLGVIKKVSTEPY